MSRRVLVRSITLLGVLALSAITALAGAIPAAAATQKKVEVEGTNWFWASQDRTRPSEILTELGVDVSEICGLAPTCPDPVVGLPNPHEPGALPVMVLNGEVEKVAAIDFDTEFLPFQGADIHSFKFSVVESMDPRDIFQTFNASERKVKACFIEDIWPPSEDAADEMRDAPPYECENGVEGVRKAGALPTDPVRWEFDVSKLVQPWGEDPFAANGFILVPVVSGSGPTETWQLVLKGPRRDVSDTPIDEAEPNKDNVLAEMSYTPAPEPPDDDGGFTPVDPVDPGDFGSVPPPGGGPPTIDPSPPPPIDPIDPGSSGEPASSSTPRSAWYMWLLVPAFAFGLAMVRSAVLESDAGPRAGGVVTMIRRHNAVRRGVPFDEQFAPKPSRLAAPFVALATAVSNDLSNARSKLRRKRS